MTDNNERTPLLKVEHLSKEFPAESGMFAKRFSKRVVSAVNDISFEIYPGETFGLVGESGCGKSTTGRTIMRLTKPTAGKVFFQGKDVAEMSKHEIKDMRREMQFIFQDPYASLNPRMTIGEIVSEPMTIHGVGTKEERIERVRELLDVVGLNPEHINRYPHEFSGGQRQRVGIARAFALKPKLIICDEPVSALDVSIQAQVLNLLKELQDKFGTAYLFIAHDLSVVQHISDRVAVMYLGKMVEVSDWKTLYSEPHHPYTQSLLSAVPVPDPDIQKTRKRIILAGDPPSPLDPPTGCRFHTRCPIAQGICSEKLPEFKEVAPGHCCACHFAEPFPIKESHIDDRGLALDINQHPGRRALAQGTRYLAGHNLTAARGNGVERSLAAVCQQQCAHLGIGPHTVHAFGNGLLCLRTRNAALKGVDRQQHAAGPAARGAKVNRRASILFGTRERFSMSGMCLKIGPATAASTIGVTQPTKIATQQLAAFIRQDPSRHVKPMIQARVGIQIV